RRRGERGRAAPVRAVCDHQNAPLAPSVPGPRTRLTVVPVVAGFGLDFARSTSSVTPTATPAPPTTNAIVDTVPSALALDAGASWSGGQWMPKQCCLISLASLSVITPVAAPMPSPTAPTPNEISAGAIDARCGGGGVGGGGFSGAGGVTSRSTSSW